MPVEFNSEILQNRADILVSGIKEATKRGLDLLAIKSFEGYDFYKHEDFLLVYLGIKPAAVYLDPILEIYCSSRINYLAFLNQPQLEITILNGNQSVVWNPQLVQEVIDQNPDMMKRTLDAIPSLATKLVSPYNPNFVNLIRELTRLGEFREAIALEGVLYGYPRLASEKFAAYYDLILSLKKIAENRLEEAGEDSVLRSPYSLYQFGRNENGLKDELLRVANSFPQKVNPYLISAVSEFRLADVPGTPYFTFGEIGREYEIKVKEAYLQSGMRQKLAEI